MACSLACVFARYLFKFTLLALVCLQFVAWIVSEAAPLMYNRRYCETCVFSHIASHPMTKVSKTIVDFILITV